MNINPIELPYDSLCFRWYYFGIYCLPTAFMCTLFMLCPVCHVLIQKDCRNILQGYYTADRLRFQYFLSKARKLTQLISDSSQDISKTKKFDIKMTKLKQIMIQTIQTSIDTMMIGYSIDINTHGMRLDKNIIKIIFSYSHSDEYFKQSLQNKHEKTCLTQKDAILAKMKKIYVYSKILHKLNSIFCVAYCTFAIILQWIGLIIVFITFDEWTTNDENDENDWRKYQSFAAMFFTLFPTFKIVTYCVSMMLFIPNTRSGYWRVFVKLFNNIDFPYDDVATRLGWNGIPLDETKEREGYYEYIVSRRGHGFGVRGHAPPNLCCIEECETLGMIGMLCGWFVNVFIPVVLIFFPFMLIGFLPFVATFLGFIIGAMIFGCCVYCLFIRGLIMNEKLLKIFFWRHTSFTILMILLMVVFGICVIETFVFGFFANEYFSIVCWYRGHEWSDCVVYAFQGQYCKNEYVPFRQYFDDGDFKTIIIALAMYL